MATYYVAHDGQQQGPFTVAEIESKLKSHKLNWHDYVYDDKAQDWVLLLEFAPLTKLFNKSFDNPIDDQQQKIKAEDPAQARVWYVLKQNNNYGPFSKTELIQMLQGKSLNEYDYIWNAQMTSWKKLSEVTEFSVEEMRKIFEAAGDKKDDKGHPVFFRRKFVRAKMNSQAVVHDHKKVYKSVGVEIGAGGAGIIVDEAEFEVNQQIYLHFKPGQNVPAFNAICRVVSKKGNQYGVQFLKISAAAKKSIADYAEAQEKKKAA